MKDVPKDKKLSNGIYVLLMKGYLANGENIVSNVITTQNIVFEIEQKMNYGIKAENDSGKGKLIIEDPETSERIVNLSINKGNLEDAYIVVKSQKKQEGKYIECDKTLSEETTIRTDSENKNIMVIFDNLLENGTYRLVFELYDKYGTKYAEETINYIIMRDIINN